MTVWHLRDLATGSKKYIKSEKVRVMNVPQFEGLCTADILKFSESYPAVAQHLPLAKEIAKLPRQYIINIVFSIVGQPFDHWVKSQIQLRNDKLLQE